MSLCWCVWAYWNLIAECMCIDQCMYSWLLGWVLGLLAVSLPSLGKISVVKCLCVLWGDCLVLLASCPGFLEVSLLPLLKHSMHPFPMFQIQQAQCRRGLKSFLMSSSQALCWQAGLENSLFSALRCFFQWPEFCFTIPKKSLNQGKFTAQKCWVNRNCN